MILRLGEELEISRHRTMKVCTCVVIFYILMFLKISNASFNCIQSTSTIAFVDSCPKDEKQWDLASKSKGCYTIAALQNCTETDKFQYHCLLNHHRNATVEVCAPVFYLQGYCPIYNTETKEITENYKPGYECLTFSGTDECPSRYQSSEVYKYQPCYNLQSLAMKTIKTSSTNFGEADTAMRFKDICVPIIVALTIIIIVCAVVVVTLLVKKKTFTCRWLKGCTEDGNVKDEEQNLSSLSHGEARNKTEKDEETKEAERVRKNDKVEQTTPLLSKETKEAERVRENDKESKQEEKENTTKTGPPRPSKQPESKQEEKENTRKTGLPRPSKQPESKQEEKENTRKTGPPRPSKQPGGVMKRNDPGSTTMTHL